MICGAQLKELLSLRGDLDELRAWGLGDRRAAESAEFLGRRGDVDELHARADASDRHTAWRLAGLLAGYGDIDQRCSFTLYPLSGGE